MQHLLLVLVFAGLLIQGQPGLSGGGKGVAAPASFTGTWQTTYGIMTLTENDGKIEGDYTFGTATATISGTRTAKRFSFTYREPDAQGEGWFELAPDGNRFSGEWRANNSAQMQSWTGQRISTVRAPDFSGLWETSYGRMRLAQTGKRVTGSYSYSSGSRIEGEVTGRTLKVIYTEPTAKGEAEFTLAADGKSFSGRWRPDGQPNWARWTGKRLEPQPGVVWLVVIEANWENSLGDPEYNFGQMLKSFFSRDPKVRVRQRFFTDEASLRKWLGEVRYLAEPVVISLSTHGQANGISVGGKTIGAAAIAESLYGADNVKLLHFSACLAMQGQLPEEIHQLLGDTKIPISGYTTSVDWGASAVFEFMYFDLLLSRGYSVRRAHDQILKLLPFGGDQQVAGTRIPALGLQLRPPPLSSNVP